MQTASYTNHEELVDRFNCCVQGSHNYLLRTDCEKDASMAFAHSVATGLSQKPPSLECRYLYDERGSRLYEEITRQPEYYLTRLEASILGKYSSELAALTGPVTMIELGSGSSVKTDHLLRAYLHQDICVCYVPIDVSESALLDAAYSITERHPEAQVIGVNDVYENAFHLMKPASPTMVVFLGSTFGNLNDQETDRFLTQIKRYLPPGDFFLLGIDLMKNPDIIEAAYNDRAGVTQEFTRNLFHRMNRELGCSIDVDQIDHVAKFSPDREQVEIFARFEKPQEIYIEPLDAMFKFKTDEIIQTEISRKYHVDKLTRLLSEYGLEPIKIWTDDHDWFALFLLQRN